MRSGTFKSIALSFIILLAGCGFDEEVQALEANASDEKIWIFAQFNVPEEKEQMDSYYYFGSVSKRLYNKITNNQVKSGFILLEDARYWGEDDLVHRYRDAQDSGELVFRIEHISRIRRLNADPILGPDSSEKQAQTPKQSAPLTPPQTLQGTQ